VVSDDTTNANNAYGPFLGKAIGQVIEAPDTLLSSITVWRPDWDSSAVGVHLFIFGVDESNAHPIFEDMVLNGPTLTIYKGEIPGEPIKVQFVFDPPFALPHKGRYGFFFQGANCWQGEPWRLFVDTNNHYAYGNYWVSNRSQGPGCPIYDPLGGYDTDIVFEAVYCDDAQTPAIRKTWGELKLIYR